KLMMEYEKLTKQREILNETIREQTETANLAKANSEIIANDLKRLQEDIENRKQKLQAIVGNQSASVLLKRTDQQLEDLRAREKAASTQLEDLKRKLENLQNQKISLQEQLRQLNERKHKADDEWRKQFENSRFQHREEFEEALAHQPMIEKWKREVSEFDERWKTVMHDLTRVEDLLQGKSVSEDEWKRTQQQLI